MGNSRPLSAPAKMDAAFLALIEKKDFAYITVKELCEQAGVNRSTFYLHYDTLDDLLAESAQYIIDQFVDFMPQDTIEFLQKLPERPLEELYLLAPEYLIPYLTYVREKKRIFQATLAHASVLRMNEAYGKLNRHVLVPILNRFQIPAEEQSYRMSFYISGLIAIINEWLKNDCTDSIAHIVTVMQHCTYSRTSH